MGFYGERILPRVIDVVMDNKAMRKGRRKVCAGLHGRVVEIGFGSGLNVPHYPTDIERVDAVEPSDRAVRLAAKRLDASPVEVEIVGLDGQRLTADDDTFDAALSTWTLCTIPDVAAALAEVRRVLKPGGTFHFVEHGAAPDEGVLRWQHRLDPVQRKLAGGCHLSRPIRDLVEAAGFEIEDLETGYVPMTPKPWGYEYLGRARKPA
jgi:ubiquinone/menaquinone biosynthesis C-methylase UbiE